MMLEAVPPQLEQQLERLAENLVTPERFGAVAVAQTVEPVELPPAA